MCSHFAPLVHIELTGWQWTSVPFVLEREHREQSAYQFEIYRDGLIFGLFGFIPIWGFDVSTHAQPRVCVLGPLS